MKLLHKLKMLWYELQMDIWGTWKFFCNQEKNIERILSRIIIMNRKI